MKFVQYYLECLSQASYLIGDETTGRAVVVDPRRDIAGVPRRRRPHGLTHRYVIETHFHADFLSGPPRAGRGDRRRDRLRRGRGVRVPHRGVADGERIRSARSRLEFRATPGHTPESISIVVWEHPATDAPYGVLTGDTLFIGDVGRPDLLASRGQPPRLAHQLYDSLHDKLLTLPDATRVYPAHGAGSACGKNLSTETVVDDRRAAPHATTRCAPMTSRRVRRASSPRASRAAPRYFVFDAELNRKAHPLLDDERPRR